MRAFLSRSMMPTRGRGEPAGQHGPQGRQVEVACRRARVCRASARVRAGRCRNVRCGPSSPPSAPSSPSVIEIAIGDVVVRVSGSVEATLITTVLRALRRRHDAGGNGLLVLVATRPVDFRKQADTLAAFVQQALGADPYSGAVYVFRAKRADRVKLLWWDGTGVCLMTKRLEGSAFRWPPVEDGVMRLSPAQLAALLEGTEMGRAGTREVERPRAAS